jgi:hypothetical protein
LWRRRFLLSGKKFLLTCRIPLEEKMAQTRIGIPLNSPELVMTGCLVEEEFPPLMSDYCQNPGDPNDEDPRIRWGELWSEEDNRDPPNIGKHIQECQWDRLWTTTNLPNTCRLTKDHLALIFEMRRDLVEQMHNQSILNKHLDILFDSLSSEPAKSFPNLLPSICLHSPPGWMPGFASCLVSSLLIF